MGLQDAYKTLDNLSKSLNKYNASPSNVLDELSSFVHSGLDEVISEIEEGIDEIERLEKEIDELNNTE